jgi:hypothetical protein
MKYKAKALIKTHLTGTFQTRLWLEIEHWFLAFHVIKFVFGHAVKECFEDEEFLQFSYRLLTPCQERSNFLEVLCNLCFLFPDESAIEVQKEKIEQFWVTREDNAVGQNFHSYSYDIRMTNDEKVQASTISLSSCVPRNQ